HAIAAILAVAVTSATAAGDSGYYGDQVRPFLTRHCLECHGGSKPKGDFRIDQLSPDFAGQANVERWLTVQKRLQAGEMPPKAKPRPPAKEVQGLSDWIRQQAAAAETTRRATEGRVRNGRT